AVADMAEDIAVEEEVEAAARSQHADSETGQVSADRRVTVPVADYTLAVGCLHGKAPLAAPVDQKQVVRFVGLCARRQPRRPIAAGQCIYTRLREEVGRRRRFLIQRDSNIRA